MPGALDGHLADPREQCPHGAGVLGPHVQQAAQLRQMPAQFTAQSAAGTGDLAPLTALLQQVTHPVGSGHSGAAKAPTHLPEVA